MSNVLRMSQEQADAYVKRIKGGVAGVVADLKAPITNKFGAQKTAIDGIEFDSKHEAERYLVLRDQQRHGEIKELKCHVPIQMKVNGVHIGTYIADFSYVTPEGKRWEDAKGYRKGSAYQLFKLKAAIVLTMGINVEEV
jgi:hypothetical protein